MSLLLAVNEIQKYFASQAVLNDVSFELRVGQRTALIGPNGAGKTTLLKILIGDIEPDRGTVELAKGAKFGFLAQRPQIPADVTVWEMAKKALEPLEKLVNDINDVSGQIAQATEPDEFKRLSSRLDQLQQELHHRDAFNLDYRIERVLQGLGFSEADFQRPASVLSGGQINRLLLGTLLLEEPDLMLLDEPSNHLDIEATEWLEDFLRNSRQTFLLVSHDRYFLDRVIDQTLELVHGSVEAYPGNFTKYQTLKSERLVVTQRSFEKQQTEIAKIEDFIRRNHYGQKASQAEDRRKKLERIERVEIPRIIVAPRMGFPVPSRTGDIVLRVEKLAKSYNTKLFSDVEFQIERGQRWGILGPNGCGKSTLLKCIVGLEQPDDGQIKHGTGVRPGYFDQHLNGIASEKISAEAIRPKHRELVDRERRDLLALFGITGDLAMKTVSSLSGGERNRVALANLAAQEANFLVLDEPTNHLDLWASAALERSLLEFDGTILVASHDRYFLNQICTHLLIFQPDRIQVFEGNYDTYRSSQQSRMQELEASTSQATSQFKLPVESVSPSPAKKKRRFPYRKAVEIEAEIKLQEALVDHLHFELTLPETLRNGAKVVALQADLSATTDAIQLLYEHWDEAMELNG